MGCCEMGHVIGMDDDGRECSLVSSRPRANKVSFRTSIARAESMKKAIVKSIAMADKLMSSISSSSLREN